jgi:hypothetical protein
VAPVRVAEVQVQPQGLMPRQEEPSHELRLQSPRLLLLPSVCAAVWPEDVQG